MTSGNSSYYFHYGPLGSVVNMTSSTDTSQWTDSYEPYGPIHSETKNNNQAPTTFMKFAGEYSDPTGLYHLRARQYDPSNGRFLTTDPMANLVTDPYMSNYAYANDGPTALIDPTGKGAVGNTCGSIKCWTERSFVGHCLKSAVEGTAITVATGGFGAGELAVTAGQGCTAGAFAAAFDTHGHESLGRGVDTTDRAYEGAKGGQRIAKKVIEPLINAERRNRAIVIVVIILRG